MKFRERHLSCIHTSATSLPFSKSVFFFSRKRAFFFLERRTKPIFFCPVFFWRRGEKEFTPASVSGGAGVSHYYVLYVSFFFPRTRPVPEKHLMLVSISYPGAPLPCINSDAPTLVFSHVGPRSTRRALQFHLSYACVYTRKYVPTRPVASPGGYSSHTGFTQPSQIANGRALFACGIGIFFGTICTPLLLLLLLLLQNANQKQPHIVHFGVHSLDQSHSLFNVPRPTHHNPLEQARRNPEKWHQPRM